MFFVVVCEWSVFVGNLKYYLSITTLDLLALLSNDLIAQRAIILLFFAPLIIISIQLKLLVCGFKLFFNIWNSLICPSANTLLIGIFTSNFMFLFYFVTKIYKFILKTVVLKFGHKTWLTLVDHCIFVFRKNKGRYFIKTCL